MSDFTKEDLKDYIEMRRNAIISLIGTEPFQGVLDSIEINRMRAILDEFTFMESWFNE